MRLEAPSLEKDDRGVQLGREARELAVVASSIYLVPWLPSARVATRSRSRFAQASSARH